MIRIPFNRPHLTGGELENISSAHAQGQLSGDGPYTRRCHAWLEQHTGCRRAFLTHSCTAALEMAAVLTEVREGDEVIMPSYTFVSTANAFVLRGAQPVFVDIRSDTLNLDEECVASAITPRTKVIVPVHYAGVACEMDRLLTLAREHNLQVVEDAAQGIMAYYRGKPLGTIGDLGCLSFHETKNVIAGEGGALLVNDERFVERAEIVREKGTNRSKFYRGEVDKYTWVDIGSSYLPGEIIAAFLLAQLEHALEITERRRRLWSVYHELLREYEEEGLLRRPVIPSHCEHNAHMYYILLRSLEERDALMRYLRSHGIYSVFHYVPLHSSPAGQKYGRTHGELRVTERVSSTLLRLPLFYDLKEEEVMNICELVGRYFRSSSARA